MPTAAKSSADLWAISTSWSINASEPRQVGGLQVRFAEAAFEQRRRATFVPPRSIPTTELIAGRSPPGPPAA